MPDKNFTDFALIATPAANSFGVGYKSDSSEEQRFTLESLPISDSTQTALDSKADLDVGGKVPSSQLPDLVEESSEALLKKLTISAPNANAALLALSGFSLTGANAQSLIDLAGTWNTSGTPTAFKLDVTDTASNAASLLLDLLVGGVSKFSVKKDGVVTISELSFTNLSTGVIYAGGGKMQFRCGSANEFEFQGQNAGPPNALIMYLRGRIAVNSDGLWSLRNAANSAYAPLLISDLRTSGDITLGETHATTPTSRTVKAHDVATGAGADLQLSGGTGSTTNGAVKLLTRGVFNLGSYAPRVALTYAGTLTPNCNDGLSRSVAMTGDQVIDAPTNGVDGMVLKLKMLASGGARELTFNAAIKMPTGATYEATVASGATRIIELEYNGTAWMLVKNLEFAA